MNNTVGKCFQIANRLIQLGSALLHHFLQMHRATRKLLLRLSQGVFRTFAFDELTDLASDPAEHLQEGIVWLAKFGTKKFHHPEELVASNDGKCKGRMQPNC